MSWADAYWEETISVGVRLLTSFQVKQRQWNDLRNSDAGIVLLKETKFLKISDTVQRSNYFVYVEF